MPLTSELVDLDPLFNSVETELVRRWAYHDVPDELACQPVANLRATVLVWWQLHQESTCAVLGINRTQWEPSMVNAQSSLDTQVLLACLEQIHQEIQVSALVSFRPLNQREQKALETLLWLRIFFSLPLADKFRKWLHLV